MKMMEKTETEIKRRLGVISIVIKDRDEAYSTVNDILHAYGKTVIGRMGIPYKERSLSIIAIIVDGTTDEIGAMTGKLGKVKSVVVKSMLTKSNGEADEF